MTVWGTRNTKCRGSIDCFGSFSPIKITFRCLWIITASVTHTGLTAQQGPKKPFLSAVLSVATGLSISSAVS